ncbi:MAG: AAA family ATPase [Tannerella sp.]|jgi:predicted AAA+ superfamily ATPase|nr:AAA family ATPase [Tannerella sp.]
MYRRNILNELTKWKNSVSRKPLVLRGVRQVGKTTAIELFAQNYAQYIYLNLERAIDRKLFTRNLSAKELLQAIFLQYNQNWEYRSNTLLFLDEIQEAPEALVMLRYFYEDFPEIHIVTAGSFLETIFDKGINFPVGRVEFRVLHPFCFSEFLDAMGESQVLELYNTIPLPFFAHDRLLQLFHMYALIGGMPEVVKSYVENRDLTKLRNVFESLLTTYFNDAEKYAVNKNQVHTIRHAIKAAFYEAGTRIKFAGFGASAYSSKEMGEALRAIEKTMLIRLVYPTIQPEPPYMPDIKKSPRLHVVDTGMLNYFSGLQTELIGTKDMNDVYRGKISEHIVGQEFLSSKHNIMNDLHFWVREKKQSDAATDFLYRFEGSMFPVEVKSGSSGKLRSLFQYLDVSKTDFAIRLYAGKISMEEHKTLSGKPFKLLNLPYYLSGKLDDYLKLFNYTIPNSSGVISQSS